MTKVEAADGGLSVGIVGTGGVGVATASAVIMRGLASRVTVYNCDRDAAQGLALDEIERALVLSDGGLLLDDGDRAVGVRARRRASATL